METFARLRKSVTSFVTHAVGVSPTSTSIHEHEYEHEHEQEYEQNGKNSDKKEDVNG